ncbi:MAG: dTDP-4-amino-4,6-dideoxygalactose transaminase [Proteobacteria bacterium]|nr:dTDP-4-amino-4,6-dideoxygalactose transaminase [Pseudomonadota bacterium]MBU4259401.1 dTDP-4-amino-4,6-dideoxygalactose transaminase [Pseudomonadota bacterium]MBU4288190.1 dTDP-4-amino-4,6-dideoxygalactose transaminase [Pseudomonadota bacterium]MBU4415090.1 dTDP-4-amino-4,6-dideoxygalactose transaminase [Pseudomonadota bacterium]MCG2757755.1 dTDP-4-amino-4,6-dideoxygalactose transaminase [Desulfobacteraceae bacterium]
MISFSKPMVPECAVEYLKEVLFCKELAGDNTFNKKCNLWIEEFTKTKKSLLTTSCTHALEMAALLININEGDEVIMPSYTFTSTANAFILRGAQIVFVDIRPDTMNMDENLIEQAISEKTRAIVPVHYAGVGCEMDTILSIARQRTLIVIEDAAQGMMSTYNGKALGSIGDLGAYSFHETKNYTCGEGGAILISDKRYVERAEIIREKGTNRSQFFRGEVDKYGWQDIGSSWLLSELNAAVLYSQLEKAAEINENRLTTWNLYMEALSPIKDKGHIDLPYVPAECKHNAHMFYIKLKEIDERTKMINYLRENGIYAVFHYVPLHSSPAGLKFSRFSGKDRYTTKESERLLRLPLFYGIAGDDIAYICQKIKTFYEKF